MYNQKIKESIDRYRERVRNTEHFKEQNRKFSKKNYHLMKEENGERFKAKRDRDRMRYFMVKKQGDVEKYMKALDKLKKKDFEFYKKVISR